jgi:uncharacterized protein (TIGR00251 family)
MRQQSNDTPAHPCADAVRSNGERLLIAVRVTPRAGRDAISCEGAVLRVRLQAPPVEGAANAALLALFAKRLRLPRHAVTLERGATSREKLIAIAGLTPDAFWRLLGM